MKILASIYLLLSVSLFSTAGTCESSMPSQFLDALKKTLPAEQVKRLEEDLNRQVGKYDSKSERSAENTTNKAKPEPQVEIINIGNVEGYFRGIDSVTKEYSLKSISLKRISPRAYCRSYINLNPNIENNISTHFINADGARENSRVQLQNVTKKGQKCYFESIKLLKPKTDKRITLKNVRTINTYGNGNSQLHIERNNPSLIQEMARCRSGSFTRRVKAKGKNPRECKYFCVTAGIK